MLSRTERQRAAVDQKMTEHGLAAKEIIQKAADEDRDRTDDENAEIAEHQAEIDNLRKKRDELDAYLKTEQEVNDLSRDIGAGEGEGQSPQPVKAQSLGELLVKGDDYRAVKESGFKGRFTIRSPEVDMKTLLAEATSISDTAVVGGVIPPDRQAGVLDILTQAPMVQDLIGSSPTTSNIVSVIQQTTNTQAAAVVPEGDGKPEATFAFDTVSEEVDTIAQSLPVTNQFLEDAPALITFVNGQLVLGVRQAEEAYVIAALYANVAAANKDLVSTAVSANDADHIYAGITAIRLAYQEPTGIVVNPENWEALRLTKDQNDNYIAGSPFSNTGSNPSESLWGKPVVVTQSVEYGKAIIVTRSAATVYRRSGVSVESSNSHSDFFVKNKTMLRAEERLAVGVWRPDGIATVNLIES